METASQWPSLGAITEQALELDPDHRIAFLEQACGTDNGLRHRVDALLEADRRAGRFLAQPAAVDLADELLGSPVERLDNPDELLDNPVEDAFSGKYIGPYRILHPLGSGGIGDVFLASRADDQYEQRVAIKVLRHRLGIDDAKRRILAERQILARLEHPNIARLYDGGTTGDGRPYLVMEYVDGQPLDTYCAQRALPLEARLALFAALCSAVQFAHQNLVVHRDLKPSNILVTSDGDLKLLDFSIAKALVPDGNLLIHETAAGSTPMTLAYASPEQIRGDPATTATDVHGLGIMLYRLLTDKHPYPIEGKPLHEIAASACEGVVLPPSRALKAESLDRASRPRAAGLPSAISLTGDLDAITLKALAKRPEDRYPSAEQLAVDLDRHRQHLPVRARPPRITYRLRKAMSRHRALFTLASVASLLVIGFVLALAAQTRRANAAASEAAAQTERARLAAASAEEVSDFLAEMISAKPRAMTPREMLDRSRREARTRFRGQPGSEARILDAIGVAYHRIGSYDTAAEVLEEALELRSKFHGAQSPEFAETLINQTRLLRATGHYSTARKILHQAIAISQANPEPDALAVAGSLLLLASLDIYQNRFHEVERHSREALRIYQAHHGSEHPSVAAAKYNLAIAFNGQGKLEEGENLLLEYIAFREQIGGPEDIGLAFAQGNLAEIYRIQGRNDEAEAFYLSSLQLVHKTYGSEHPNVGIVWLNLGSFYVETARLERAERALAETRRLIPPAFDHKHPWAIELKLDTALLRLQQGKTIEAEQIARLAHADAKAHIGSNDPLMARCAEAWAQTLAQLGQTEEAEHLLDDAYRVHLSVHGELHPKSMNFCDRYPTNCANSSK